MTELMRKIQYYENILEFKQNTGTELQMNEVKELQFCRLCLADPNADDCDLLKMCVIGMDAKLISLNEMLTAITDLKIVPVDDLPAKVCKECLNKISTFYFFKLQTKRAQDVLKRLQIALNYATGEAELEKGIAREKQTDRNDREETNIVDTTVNDADCMNSENDEDNNINIKHNITTYSVHSSNAEAAMLQERDDNLESETDDFEIIHVENTLRHKSTDEQKASTTNESPNQNFVIQQQRERNESTENDEFLTDDGNISDTFAIEIIEDSQNTEHETDYCERQQQIDYVHTNEQQEEVEMIKSENKTLVKISAAWESNTEKTTRKIQRKQRTLTKNLLESLNCAICNKIFDVQRELIHHVNRQHPGEKAFRCCKCGGMFAHMQSLSRHMHTHKKVQNKNVCSFCGKEFLRCDDWKRHLRTHTGQRPYVCNICQKAFKQTSELNAHLLSHDKEQKHYGCHICNHRLSSRNGLYIHMKAHKGLKNFICAQCNKGFLTNGELKSHSRVHKTKAHEKTSVTVP